MRSTSFRGIAIGVAVYALAMAYLESAVVVYLRAALGMSTGDVFPVSFDSAGNLGWIEVGREAATLLMIGGVAWIAGRSPLERLAWAAVVFGIWDIGYYAWLWVFSGWPTGLGTWDLLFLLRLPGPGRSGRRSRSASGSSASAWPMRPACAREARCAWRARRLAVVLLGGLVVIVAFLTNAGLVLDGGTPRDFAWPIFASGWRSAWCRRRSAAGARCRV